MARERASEREASLPRLWQGSLKMSGSCCSDFPFFWFGKSARGGERTKVFSASFLFSPTKFKKIYSMPLLHLAASAATPPPPSPTPKPPPLSSSPSPRKAAKTARRRLAKAKLKKQQREERELSPSKNSKNSKNSPATASSKTTTTRSPLSTSTSKTLRDLSARPKGALGQNFVIDEQVLDSVTRAALLKEGGEPRRGVGVLEVGPGTGNLTRRLLGFSPPASSLPAPDLVVSALTAVEKDDALSENLKGTLEVEEPRLRIVHEDFLRVNLPEEVQALRERAAVAGDASSSSSSSTSSSSSSSSPLPRAVVVANLPYNITSDALRLLLPMGDSISEVYLMLQDEAARRLAGAREGDGDWRGASALARYFSDPEVLFGISASCFLPRPRVDSAFVRFRLKRPEERVPRASDEKLLRAVIRAAFAQRRKALRNSLGALVGCAEASAAISAAGLDPLSARADAVSVPQFVAIANAIVEASDPATVLATVLATVEAEEETETEKEVEEEGEVEEGEPRLLDER